MLVLGLGPVLKDSLRTVGKSLVLALALKVKSLLTSLTQLQSTAVLAILVLAVVNVTGDCLVTALQEV